MWSFVHDLLDWYEVHPDPYTIDHDLLYLLDDQCRDLLNDLRLQSCIEDQNPFWIWVWILLDGYLYNDQTS